MRTLWLMILSLTALTGFAHDQILPQMKAPPELVTPEALTEFLNGESEQLTWPEFVLKKEIGAQLEGKRLFVYAIFHLKTIERKDVARLVMKASGVFASALFDNAQIYKATVTFKCPGHTARLFLPMPALRALSEDMNEQVQFTFAQKKELVKACDWYDVDRVVDECERLKFEDGPRRTVEPPLPGLLQRVVLKDDRFIEAGMLQEVDDCYLLQDERGVFMRLRCSDVKRILPPDPKRLVLK